MMEVKNFTASDVLQLPDLQPDGWPDIRVPFEFYGTHAYCFPLKITEGEKIIGVGSATVHNEVAWLGHIIVHPDHRNKGIGKTITQSLLDLHPLKSCPTIYLIATDLGEPVYRKLGFEDETDYLFFKDIRVNLPTSGSIINYLPQYKTQVAELDRVISGEDRWFHLEEHLANAKVFVDGGRVEGFFLPALGEGLIVAATSRAGVELTKMRLNSNERASFPVDNVEACALMKELGYQSFRVAKRMRRGQKRLWEPGGVFNRIGGNLG